MNFKTLLFALASLAACSLPIIADDRPNIVLIMVDDLGFSDLGCYGGEIETPNLDRLAHRGLRFTQFYNCAKCETTRSTMLSGRYYPEVNNQKLENCVTIAEALSNAGYTTLMTGKWHLEPLPNDRGFDRFFGHLSGATNFFWGDDTFRLDEDTWTVPKTGFYTTDANIDFALQFLKESTKPEKPFFLYVAFNAPHYPLQAPQKDVEKYLKRYEMGWDQIRQTRLKSQADLGLFASPPKAAARPNEVPEWNSLGESERQTQQLMMATYAAMIDRVDQNIGRLMNTLEQQGKADNTIFMFLSDNGACPFQRTRETTRLENRMPWDPSSYWTYDKGWAHACNTPFREYKQNQHEGGITTPFIVHWPKSIEQPGRITHQPGHIVDIMATCLDLAETSYPTEFKGRAVGPPRGVSLQPIMKGKTRSPQDLYFTFYGKNNAFRSGDWKLVNKNTDAFELYDLSSDRTELKDLAKSHTEKYDEMKSKWDQLAKQVGQAEKKKNKNGKKKNSKNNPKRQAAPTKAKDG
ncbi:MAG: arylsulfatase [Mariniblastus sp.]|nr:arylsulfatase [Mariniblastus sp.]